MRGQRADSLRHQQSRLPPIAPKEKVEDQGTGSHPTSPVDGSHSGSATSRLPPRSRSGCWTCRTRKVKCDEQRPACGQCLRLDHTCDYNPRVLFKDDTPRVVERMQEVTTAGNFVWDPTAIQHEHSQTRSVEDLLPPFSALTTDEDRERKAELKNPGTYHVVANIDSFEALPEYREGNTLASSSGETGGFTSPAGRLDEDDALSNLSADPVGVAEDPNVVFLKMFEDPNRKSSPQQPNKSITNPVSPASSHASVATTSRHTTQRSTFHADTQGLSMLDIARSGGRDAELLQHYRNIISPSILRAHRPEGDEDLFEIQARSYPPLFHAMMALAAISMAVQNGAKSTDALEHYQQVIPALKIAVQSSEDSYSDGALFTHFILLVYEIAAAGHREHNMWQHHSDQLLKIVTLRRQAYGVETYDFLIWLVCRMDIYALLSASGTGIFVDVLLKENMLPAPERTLPPLSLNQESVVYLQEQPFFPTLQKVNREVFLTALQIGQVARELRTEARSRQYENHNLSMPDSLFVMDIQARVQKFHRFLEHSRATWQNRFPEYGTWLMDLKSLPHRAFAWIQHSYMLLRACLIYAHTSLFPGQLRHPAPDSKLHVTTCVTEILQAARFVASQEHVDPRFMVFPLFIAGFAASEPAEKDLALTMIRAVEQHSFGGCTQSVRELLEIIYEKQRVAILSTGDSTLVDWVEEIELRGQPPIIYGI